MCPSLNAPACCMDFTREMCCFAPPAKFQGIAVIGGKNLSHQAIELFTIIHHCHIQLCKQIAYSVGLWADSILFCSQSCSLSVSK